MKTRPGFLLSGVLCLALWASVAVAQNIPEGPKVSYTADITMRTKRGNESHDMKMKIYQSQKKQRFDSQAQGHLGTTIRREDKGVTWILMPEQKIYMESPIGQVGKGENSFSANPDELKKKGYKFEKVGAETINGQKCDKYRIEDKDEEEGMLYTGFIWLTKDNVPMKMQMDGKGRRGTERMEYETKNLKIGEPDKSVFEIPSGYQKQTMPDFSAMGHMGRHGMNADESDDEEESDDSGSDDYDGQGAPSKAQMDAMKKQMEEMMKKMGK